MGLRGKLFTALIVAEAMIEIALLPMNTMVPSGPSLPLSDHLAHVFARGKGSQRMQMIGHQHENSQPPAALLVIKLGRFKQGSGERWLCEQNFLLTRNTDT